MSLRRALPLLGLLPFLLGAGASTAPMRVSVLSYNVHGLPAWIAGDAPETRMPIISTLLNRYAVALIQEDWEWHEQLVASAEHEVVERGNEAATELRGSLGLNGSGLTTLAGFAPAQALAVTREALGACAGWIGGGMDCWASKGFLRVRLRLEGDAEVDFYNVHLDAGAEPADREARAAQLERLAERMEALSAEAAIVLGGDLNSDAHDPDDKRILDAFLGRLELIDSGAGAAQPGKRLDYIFFRDSARVRLSPVAADQAAEFVHQGEPLSDHPALFTTFEVNTVDAARE